MTGTMMVVEPGKSACLACVYPETPPFEEFFPVVGAISSMTGTMAALEAIKILSGTGKPVYGKMLTYDAFEGRMTTIQLERRADCPVCS